MEAAALAGVAGRALLVDEHQQRVAVAVQPDVAHPLPVARRLALHPVLAPAARPVGGPAGGQGAVQRLVVHPGEHQHLAGVVLLDDGGDQAGGVAAQQRGDRGVEGRDRRTCRPVSRTRRQAGRSGSVEPAPPGPTTHHAQADAAGRPRRRAANAASAAVGSRHRGRRPPSVIRRIAQYDGQHDWHAVRGDARAARPAGCARLSARIPAATSRTTETSLDDGEHGALGRQRVEPRAEIAGSCWAARPASERDEARGRASANSTSAGLDEGQHGAGDHLARPLRPRAAAAAPTGPGSRSRRR